MLRPQFSSVLALFAYSLLTLNLAIGQVISPISTEESAGSDPVIKKLDVILQRLEQIEARLSELESKVGKSQNDLNERNNQPGQNQSRPGLIWRAATPTGQYLLHGQVIDLDKGPSVSIGIEQGMKLDALEHQQRKTGFEPMKRIPLQLLPGEIRQRMPPVNRLPRR